MDNIEGQVASNRNSKSYLRGRLGKPPTWVFILFPCVVIYVLLSVNGSNEGTYVGEPGKDYQRKGAVLSSDANKKSVGGPGPGTANQQDLGVLSNAIKKSVGGPGPGSANQQDIAVLSDANKKSVEEPGSDYQRKGAVLLSDANKKSVRGPGSDDQGQASALDELRSKHLFPYDPSLPTNLTRVSIMGGYDRDWKQVMPKIIAKHLNYKRNGFFIECGALDGMAISNTLLLEMTYGWTGLLVEPDPKYTPILKSRNRNAWVADVCLSPKPFPTHLDMTGHNEVGGQSFIPNDVIRGKPQRADVFQREFRVDCFPLPMILSALNVTEIDYFSLDVEGMELDILRTIPFDKIRIKLMSLEVRHQDPKRFQDFLEPLGYKKIRHVSASSDIMEDDLYEFQG